MRKNNRRSCERALISHTNNLMIALTVVQSELFPIFSFVWWCVGYFLIKRKPASMAMNYDPNGALRISFDFVRCQCFFFFPDPFIIDVSCLGHTTHKCPKGISKGRIKKYTRKTLKRNKIPSHKFCVRPSSVQVVLIFRFAVCARTAVHSCNQWDDVINRSGKTIIHLPEKLNAHIVSNK